MAQAVLTVWRFDDPSGGRDAARALAARGEESLMPRGCAVVTWAVGDRAPAVDPGCWDVGPEPLEGAYWGLLLGLVFFVRILGEAADDSGALTGSLADVGIGPDLVEQVRERVTPGTSALLALTTGAGVD